jgi:hypothetical protein
LGIYRETTGTEVTTLERCNFYPGSLSTFDNTSFFSSLEIRSNGKPGYRRDQIGVVHLEFIAFIITKVDGNAAFYSAAYVITPDFVGWMTIEED